MVTAPVPAPIIEKGLASDRVVIDAVISKYCDHLPLYRQSAMFLRDAGRCDQPGDHERVDDASG